MQLYLGIDGGGTRTRARLVDSDGTLLGSGEAGPANSRGSVPDAVRAILGAARSALEQAGLGDNDFPRIPAGLGIAGLERPDFLAGLAAYPFPFSATRLAGDAEVALLGAHGGGDGAVVIIGTGSIGLGRHQGQSVTVGGYGFPVSDEGSGAYVGLKALRRTLWASDGRAAHTGMTHAVLERFAGSSAKAVEWGCGAAPRDYATFAPLVMDFAERHDSVAEGIAREAGRHIGMMVEALVARTGPRCALMGGMSERILPWLPERARAHLREPQGDALDGAILLARRGEQSP
jgi:glucosamine kinase